MMVRLIKLAKSFDLPTFIRTLISTPPANTTTPKVEFATAAVPISRLPHRCLARGTSLSSKRASSLSPLGRPALPTRRAGSEVHILTVAALPIARLE